MMSNPARRPRFEPASHILTISALGKFIRAASIDWLCDAVTTRVPLDAERSGAGPWILNSLETGECDPLVGSVGDILRKRVRAEMRGF